MSILDPRTWLIWIGIAALAFTGGYVTHWKGAKNKAVAAGFEQYKADTKKVVSAADKLEVKNDRRNVEYKSIEKIVEKIVYRDVYRSECVDDDGLRVINQALKGGVAAKPDKTLPAAK